jgi:hypothetical protein
MRAPTLHEFIRDLGASGTKFALTSVREGAIMVQIALPGERWEVEFFDDREPEVEVFRSDGTISGPEVLAKLSSDTKGS